MSCDVAQGSSGAAPVAVSVANQPRPALKVDPAVQAAVQLRQTAPPGWAGASISIARDSKVGLPVFG